MESKAGAGRFVLLAAVVFVLAVLAARALLTGGLAWTLFLLGLPVLFLLLRLVSTWAIAAILLLFFTAAVLALRVLLTDARAGWPYLLLVPLVVAAAALGYKVVRGMLVLRKGKDG